MARIRTIKPEFWSSKTLASVSRDSRLTFIGLWTLADDLGILLDMPKSIAGDLYPHDDTTGNDINNQLNELEAAKLIVRVTENNKDFIIIRSWDEHQKIDRPSKHTHLSRDTRDTLASSHRWEKEKEKEKEKEILVNTNVFTCQIPSAENSKIPEESSETQPRKKTEPIPYQAIVDLYQEKLPMLNGVYKLTEQRKAKIKTLWTTTELNSLETWGNYFIHVSRSKFLTGRDPPDRTGRTWKADLDFLINQTNFVKISEDKYHG